MPALNFKRRFAPDVKSGKKTQTIRAKRKHPVKVGDTLYLYTGMRTKYCEKLRESVCTEVLPVEILDNGVMTVSGIPLNKTERDEMAQCDGFQTWNDMYIWFKDTHGYPFEGDLIKWKP